MLSKSPNYPTNINQLAKDDRGQPLVCSGCAHAAASAPFPGRPSGERPCFFCIRNVQREQWIAEAKAQHQPPRLLHRRPGYMPSLFRFTSACDPPPQFTTELPAEHPAHGVWYNGSKAFKCPMDCYSSIDRITQSGLWLEAAAAYDWAVTVK